MSPEDLDRIERELEVTLPSDYRALMRDFPIKFEVGNCDGDFWDEAGPIIERNQTLRSSRRSLGVQYEALPAQYLFVGEDGAGWQHLIDLDSDPTVLHTMEFEQVKTIRPNLDDQGNPQTPRDWLDVLMKDLVADGIDVNSTKSPAPEWTPGCLVAFIVLAAVVTLIVKCT